MNEIKKIITKMYFTEGEINVSTEDIEEWSIEFDIPTRDIKTIIRKTKKELKRGIV